MTELVNIEKALNLSTSGRRLHNGLNKTTKNRYLKLGKYLIVELTKGKWLACYDNAISKYLLKNHIWRTGDDDQAVSNIIIDVYWHIINFHIKAMNLAIINYL